MSRTAAQAKAAAQVALDNGNPDFEVLSVEDLDYGARRFHIQLPLTVAYLGWFGSLPFPAFLATQLTKFGRGLDHYLAAIDGCTTRFSEQLPTVVRLDYSGEPDETPNFGLRHRTKELPMSVCLAIQVAIEQHNTPLRRALETIRRVI